VSPTCAATVADPVSPTAGGTGSTAQRGPGVAHTVTGPTVIGGTGWVSSRLGCTSAWIAVVATEADKPGVSGTGPWPGVVTVVEPRTSNGPRQAALAAVLHTAGSV